MRVYRLRTYDLPDVGDDLIHFSGRLGPRINVTADVVEKSPQQRLVHILIDNVIRGFQTFGAGAPVVCLTESTRAAVMRLVSEGRYEPCGIVFSKQSVFDGNGGPALYVRGDEWQAATAALDLPLRSRLVRFWPGAQEDPAEFLPDHLKTISEWLHEREWRVPDEFRFGWDNVRFLIVPNGEWQPFYAEWVAGWAGEEYAAAFAAIPAVVMDNAGQILDDSAGVWT
jgi:hypothetical protein